jgi:hypothetical protein
MLTMENRGIGAHHERLFSLSRVRLRWRYEDQRRGTFCAA